MMKTGQSGDMDTGGIENAAMDLFLPVVESAAVLAGHYAKACGRNCVMAEDMSYGLMYAARNVAGRQIGSLYPELYENSDTETDSDDSESDSDESPWSRYEGTEDDTARNMNDCVATWDQWEPTNPVERALKNAVDKNSFFGR